MYHTVTPCGCNQEINRRNVPARRPFVAGLGFTTPEASTPLFDFKFDWKTAAVLAVVAYLIYRFWFSERATDRRYEFAKARVAYQQRRRRIRQEWPL